MRGFRDDSRETTWAESKCRPLGTCKAETDVPMLRAVSEKREGECSWHCYTECCEKLCVITVLGSVIRASSGMGSKTSKIEAVQAANLPICHAYSTYLRLACRLDDLALYWLQWQHEQPGMGFLEHSIGL